MITLLSSIGLIMGLLFLCLLVFVGIIYALEAYRGRKEQRDEQQYLAEQWYPLPDQLPEHEARKETDPILALYLLRQDTRGDLTSTSMMRALHHARQQGRQEGKQEGIALTMKSLLYRRGKRSQQEGQDITIPSLPVSASCEPQETTE